MMFLVLLYGIIGSCCMLYAAYIVFGPILLIGYILIGFVLTAWLHMETTWS